MQEERRIAGTDSWDVWSNYIFCPSLCRTCKYFYQQKSNWPYHCKAGTSQAVSHSAKRDGYEQYDDCIAYENA